MADVPDKIQAYYRSLFLRNGTIGLEVLEDIMRLCHFGETMDPDNKVQVSEYNVGIAILHRCGIFEIDTFKQVIRALANVVPRLNEEEE